MKGFSFDSFVVHETNQAAYDICKKLAAGEKDLPRPVVLLGESGSGKSHLLWSIVNDFRERDAKVGVALISAKDFPRKVKALPDNPEKLKKKYPVILMVDELHLFEKDLKDLERVMLAFQEYNQYVIVASNIHPSILPSLSGKLKSFLNNGAIVGIKSLPKSGGAPIPEAATKQIAALKARIAELESGKGAAGATAADPNELTALREELEKTKHERDVARTALDRSEGELIDLREEVEQLRAGGGTADDSEITAIVERLEKQKTVLMERINALEKELDDLLAYTQTLEDESAMQEPKEELTAAQEQSELFSLIDGIRETLKQFEEEMPEDATEAEEPPNKAKQTLATIAEQLRILDQQATASKSEDAPADDAAEAASDDAPEDDNAADDSAEAAPEDQDETDDSPDKDAP